MSNGNTFEHDNWKFTEELKSETDSFNFISNTNRARFYRYLLN
jgi:hypothetical protein